MRVATTGATGFLGRYIVEHLIDSGYDCRCWYRPTSDRGGLEPIEESIEWVLGELGDTDATRRLVEGCDAVVHSALHHPSGGFRGDEGDLTEFAEKNLMGTIRLMESAVAAGVKRFVFISTCAVHETILDDRPLDETHPLWPTSHYGAHKAALEKFVHSYGFGQGWPVCALRPTGIYGLARPAEQSKWFELIRSVVAGETVHCNRGGKEVHAADVARAVGVLLKAEPDRISGEAFSCYDQYISQFDVATIAKELTQSSTEIAGGQTRPRHQIGTDKIRGLGMEFGGETLLKQTIQQIVDAVG